MSKGTCRERQTFVWACESALQEYRDVMITYFKVRGEGGRGGCNANDVPARKHTHKSNRHTITHNHTQSHTVTHSHTVSWACECLLLEYQLECVD